MSDYPNWAEWVEDHDERVSSTTHTPAAPDPLSRKADRPTEAMIQQDVVRWARAEARSERPCLQLLHSTPNEGFANLPGKTAADRRKMGVLRGVPDLHLPVPSQGETQSWPALWLELKRPGEDLSAVQWRRLKQLDAEGNAVEVAWTAEQAIFVIEHYLDAPNTFLSGY